MAFDLIPYDRVAFKASHNSYQRDEDLHVQLVWDAARPWQSGCRGLELDVTRHSDSSAGTHLSYFQISHDKGGSGPPLGAYLGYLLSFHANHPNHDPVFLTVDVKSESGSRAKFPKEIDSYLREWFDASLIWTPADMLARSRASRDLCAAVARAGWPSVGELRGKFLFCLSGNKDWKRVYADDNPKQRLCFADRDVSDDDPNVAACTGNRAIVNMHLFTADHGVWSVTIPRFHLARQLVRGYELGSSGLWSKALAAGVNVLATDQVRGRTWAHVGTEAFAPIA